MTVLAQALQVARIVKHLDVTLVWLDVIDDRGLLDDFPLEAVLAQWLFGELSLTKCGPPLAAV